MTVVLGVEMPSPQVIAAVKSLEFAFGSESVKVASTTFENGCLMTAATGLATRFWGPPVLAGAVTVAEPVAVPLLPSGSVTWTLKLYVPGAK